MKSSVCFEAMFEAAATDRLWPVSDCRKATLTSRIDVLESGHSN